MRANLSDFERLAHLKQVPMPGGSMAIKEPWRMALAYLFEAFGDKAMDLELDWVKRRDPQKCGILKRMIEKSVNSPLTSSMGRLFDAVSSLLSIRDTVNYEGQAAIELEMIADPEGKEEYPFEIQEKATAHGGRSHRDGERRCAGLDPWPFAFPHLRKVS